MGNHDPALEPAEATGRSGASPADHGPAASGLSDEDRADETRRRLRAQGIVPIEPDERVGVMLRPDEQLVAVRHAVSLERRSGRSAPDHGLRGDLYVTTQRLLHVGRLRVECPLDEIREAIVGDDALLLVVNGYRGITLWVSDPRALRVEIAAVREAARVAAEAARVAAEAIAEGRPANLSGSRGPG